MKAGNLVHSFLEQSAERFPDKVAIITQNERISYKALHSRTRKICQYLIDLKLKNGDRVAILTDQVCEYVAAYFGILEAGGIAVGLNTQTSEKALAALLSDSECAVVFTSSRFQKYYSLIKSQNSVRRVETDIRSIWEMSGEVPSTEPVHKVSLEDIAQIIYTSGTTGKPKGVMLRHSNLVANTESIVEDLGLVDTDRVMMVLPFFYSYGNSILLSHIAVGGSLVVNQNFTYPNVILDQMVKEGVTGFSGVPSTYALLVNRSAVKNYVFPNLRYLTQAGAAMTPTLAKELSEIFPSVRIFIMYGQTEAAPRLSSLNPDKLYEKTGSIGKAIPGVILEVCRPDGTPAAVGEVGEIVASGKNIMAGYWRNPEETKRVLKNGKLWTGDLARVDKDGYLFIEGRKSALIKSGSHRIAPKEIENVISEISCIHEVAVVGQQDKILGEKIVAYVVVKPDHTAVGKEIIRHCRLHLPSYKVPHKIIMIDELPKTTTGKIQTALLKNS